MVQMLCTHTEPLQIGVNDAAPSIEKPAIMGLFDELYIHVWVTLEAGADAWSAPAAWPVFSTASALWVLPE